MDVDVDAAVPSTDTSEAPLVEIPYLPASQRQTAKVVVEDSIVVVGQPKQKKRKRPKASSSTPHGEISGPADAVEDDAENTKRSVKAEDSPVTAEPEPFDFSTVPNILDEVPPEDHDPKQHKKKRSKKRHDGELPVVLH
jgi:exosome complex exonuclease RRP6